MRAGSGGGKKGWCNGGVVGLGVGYPEDGVEVSEETSLGVEGEGGGVGDKESEKEEERSSHGVVRRSEMKSEVKGGCRKR